MTYHYWTVRWVPDVARGEFVNIGVLVGADDDWAFRGVTNLQRATSLGGDAGRATSILKALEGRVQRSMLPAGEAWGGEPLSHSEIERMRSHQSNAVQLAAPRLLHARTATEGLEIIYPLMVEEHPRRTRDTTRRKLIRDLQQDLDLHLGQRVTTMRGSRARADGQRGSFDLLIEHGEQMHLAHAWSFANNHIDQVATNHQSWAWFVRMFRKDGAQLYPRAGATRVIDKDTPLSIVHDRPRSAEQREVFNSAEAAWRELGVTAFDREEIPEAVTAIGSGFALAG